MNEGVFNFKGSVRGDFVRVVLEAEISLKNGSQDVHSVDCEGVVPVTGIPLEQIPIRVVQHDSSHFIAVSHAGVWVLIVGIRQSRGACQVRHDDILSIQNVFRHHCVLDPFQHRNSSFILGPGDYNSFLKLVLIAARVQIIPKFCRTTRAVRRSLGSGAVEPRDTRLGSDCGYNS
jgi:hypothetical protein